MVGLPFPNSVVDTREPSWDHGTPFSGSGDIPIDPALSDGSLDPALFAENGVSAKEEVRGNVGQRSVREMRDAELAKRVASRSCLCISRTVSSLIYSRVRHPTHLRPILLITT